MSGPDKSGGPATIQTLLGEDYTCQRRFRPADRERIASARVVLESSYADLVEFIDGDIHVDPYFVVDSDKEEDVQAATFDVYKLLHHYLAALYSFNEALRATVTAYLPEGIELTKSHFKPEDGQQTEYTRRLMYLRGLRIAAQHGAFNDCLPVEQWDSTSNEYRLGFDEVMFSQHERIQEAGTYLRYSNEIRQREPLKYIGSFHTTNFHPFYDDCLAWFDTYYKMDASWCIRLDNQRGVIPSLYKNEVETDSVVHPATAGFTTLIARPKILHV